MPSGGTSCFYQGFHLCITKLPWLSIQTCLGLCDPDNSLFILSLNCVHPSTTGDKGLFVSHNWHSPDHTLSHQLLANNPKSLITFPKNILLCHLCRHYSPSPPDFSNVCIITPAMAFWPTGTFPRSSLVKYLVPELPRCANDCPCPKTNQGGVPFTCPEMGEPLDPHLPAHLLRSISVPLVWFFQEVDTKMVLNMPVF